MEIFSLVAALLLWFSAYAFASEINLHSVEGDDENLCALVLCVVGNECDPLNGECVPVSCEAPNACEEQETCVPADIQCIRSPCPQFTCEPEVPPLSCTTTCGKSIEVGQSFRDDGNNYCNVCSCQESGISICSLILCDPLPFENVCGLFEGSCETECGNLVGNGVSFQDDGANSCNSCVCVDGQKSCTKVPCLDEEPSCPGSSNLNVCFTQCGNLVGDGVSFSDDGPNFCNSCSCENGGTICTEIGCNLNDEQATCEEKEECQCEPNFECDIKTKECVPVNCEAEGACEVGEICVATPGIPCLVSPCPQFVCEPDNICSRILCDIGTQCDPLIGGCVPISCEAEEACDEGFICEEEERLCVREPCPQFKCVDARDGCVTECGRLVPPFTYFKGDGEDYCRHCICFKNDGVFCVPFSCPEDEELSKCEEKEGCADDERCEDTINFGCDLIGNECIPITCEAPGACPDGKECVPEELFCIRDPCPQFICRDEGLNPCDVVDCDIGSECDPLNGDCVPVSCESPLACPDDEECVPREVQCITNPCPQFECKKDTFCETTCGVRKEVGESFQDDGSNYCNTCTCQEQGFSICTLVACEQIPVEEGEQICDKFRGSCETTCGIRVGNGVSFQDDGSNSCNSCVCVDGDKACTDLACTQEDVPACPISSIQDVCLTTCGNLVGAGVSYTDDGSNFCNRCSCENGASACTERGCVNPPECT